jgi:hypothetical protein
MWGAGCIFAELLTLRPLFQVMRVLLLLRLLSLTVD